MRHFALLVAAGLIAPAAGASAATTCATLLTSAEVEAAAGKGFEDMGPTDRGEGESECAWMSRGAGGFKLIAVTFRAEKGAEEYEAEVAANEDAAGGKREAIAGVAGKAAFLKFGEQLVAVVHTAGGVARVGTNGLTKAQVTALAKAVSGPAATGAAAVAIPKSERIEGDAILAHPIGTLAVRYATALHAKGGDVALYSRSAQAKRQALPKSERAESDAFMRKMVPAAAAIEAAIRNGGVLMLEGPKATLNLVRMESTKNADGSVTSSSSTSGIPFELEDGVWKVAK